LLTSMHKGELVQHGQKNKPLCRGNGKYISKRNMALHRGNGKYVRQRKLELGSVEE